MILKSKGERKRERENVKKKKSDVERKGRDRNKHIERETRRESFSLGRRVRKKKVWKIKKKRKISPRLLFLSRFSPHFSFFFLPQSRRITAWRNASSCRCWICTSIILSVVTLSGHGIPIWKIHQNQYRVFHRSID